MKYASKILAEVVEGLSSLPGVGKKTALRLALHLAQRDKLKVIELGNEIIRLAEELETCKTCYSYSDSIKCDICANVSRNQKIVCVVESIKDLMAIEETMQFNGVYHVLGGLISPMDGIGPDQLNIEALFKRIHQENIEEIIMAIRPSIDGDTTTYFISKNISKSDLKISLIARGVSFGSELEYADELTLGRSIISRVPYLLTDN